MVALACLVGSGTAPAFADDPVTFDIAIKDHKFDPAEVKVPAGKPLVLKVRNLDATPEEFESNELKIEKIIAGGTVGIVRLRPLEPGRYEFKGEFHEDTARGALIVE